LEAGVGVRQPDPRPRPDPGPGRGGEPEALARGAAPRRRPDPVRPLPGRDEPRMTFDEARAQFPVFERLAYLNAGSAGPLARPAPEAMAAQEWDDLENGRCGPVYVERAWALREEVRAKLAGLVGVPAENLALATSTTNGCNIVLAGLDLGPDDEVV